MASIFPPAAADSDGKLFQWVTGLVERHGRYATNDLADAQRHLHGMHDSIFLSVGRPEDFVGYSEVLLNMGNLVVSVGCIDARSGYDLSFESGDEYLIIIPLRGSGWASTGGLFVEYGRDDIMIVAPLCRVQKHWDGPGETLSIHVPAARFDAVIASLNIGGRPSAPIVRIGACHMLSFLRALDMVYRDLRDSPGSSPFLREPLASQIEIMLLSLLLQQLPAETGGIEPGASAAVPYYVRRAEAFIAGNAHRDIGLGDVAAAADVSSRTIQYGFRRFRDTTPMLYLKRKRYERARKILLSGSHARRIGDIAAEIGCANISQFSRDYRSLFGESPSQTIAAPRRLVP